MDLTSAFDILNHDFIVHINDERDSAIIMEKHGVGMIRMIQESDNTMYLDYLSVVPFWRNKKLGTKLLAIAELSSSIINVSTIIIMIKNDTWLIDWYLRKGYQRFEDSNRPDNEEYNSKGMSCCISLNN
jgi:GNAT superfamily N-acetyltransferase